MPAIAIKKGKSTNVTVVRKMKDYSKETAFKKRQRKPLRFKEAWIAKSFYKEE